MKRTTRHVLIAAALLAVGLYLLALVVPVDPEERRPGLRLSGTVAEAPVDWRTRLAPREKIYVQTRTPYGIPHSVTTVSFTLDGALYVPCARCSGKRWPKNVARDPAVVVKVGNDLYPRRAIRVEDPALLARLFGGRDEGLDDVWMFRMDAPES